MTTVCRDSYRDYCGRDSRARVFSREFISSIVGRHDGRQDRDAEGIREGSGPEFQAVRTMADHAEHPGDQLCLHGELHRVHGSGEPAELDQR